MDPIYALGHILDPIFALGRILDPISPPCSTVTMVNVQIDFYYVISAHLYNNGKGSKLNEVFCPQMPNGTGAEFLVVSFSSLFTL